jgi:hypothetical protein
MKRTSTLNRVLSISILLLVFFSCKKEATVKSLQSKTAETVQVQKDSNFVRFDLAAAAAKQINQSQLVNSIKGKMQVNGLSLPVNKEILDTLALPDNVNPSYYIFNYVGGGYVIIAADKRVSPILGYDSNGYFPHTGNLSEGLINWLEVNHENMQSLRKNSKLKVPAGVAHAWAELVPASNTGRPISVNNMDNAPHPPCTPLYLSVTVGPYLTTTWGQGQPYNLLCPAGSYDGSHSPTGCVATAMAQVMYYWKAPAYYNWNSMPTSNNYNGISYPGNTDVAQLMLTVGQSVNMDYQGTVSSTDGSKCVGAFKNTFGYQSAANGDYNYQTVRNNLDAREPVLLSGSTDHHSFLWFNLGFSDGHEWVCDGYNEITTRSCPTYNPYTGDIATPATGATYAYLHMNWGWDNQNNCNGWFAFDKWEVMNGPDLKNWQYNQSMTYNIHP